MSNFLKKFNILCNILQNKISEEISFILYLKLSVLMKKNFSINIENIHSIITYEITNLGFFD